VPFEIGNGGLKPKTRKVASKRSSAAAPALLDDADTLRTPKPEWERLRPRTLVDQAAEAIIAGAARGVILPGDRIVEAELARQLGVSRVPVREALRLLESQGVVTNEPYKGIRLTPVTMDRLCQILEVRVALETTAARQLFRMGHLKPKSLAALDGCIDRMRSAALKCDAYSFAGADTAFHQCLCRLSGNEVLCSMWEQIARQLIVIFGLSTLDKSTGEIIAEHERLLKALSSNSFARIQVALEEHIKLQNLCIDFEMLIAKRRAVRAGKAAATDDAPRLEPGHAEPYPEFLR
jgi:DNA-binding GntR family transcriptional regulator